MDCPCWCHKDPQPEYDSYRDYFETHATVYCRDEGLGAKECWQQATPEEQKEQ